MARVLKRTVVAGGVTYPAGTAESSALTKAIPNAKAWEGEPDADESPTPARKKAAPARKRTAAKASTETKAPSESPPVTDESTSQEPPPSGAGAGDNSE